MAGALGLHVLALFGFDVSLNRSVPQLPETIVEVALVATRPPETVIEPTPPIETAPIVEPQALELPEPAPQIVEKRSEPVVVNETPQPEPQIAKSEPVAESPSSSPQEIQPQSLSKPILAPRPEDLRSPDQAQGIELPQIAQPPKPISRNPKPPYPLLARERRQEGTVLLRVKVSDAGRIQEAEIKQSSGFPLLDKSALKTIRRYWQFEPARSGLAPVAAEMEIPIRFQLIEDGS